ncbi:DNA mismatch repair protein MSH5-like isoform X2 [Populus alba x Populus x berolinensis]|nr:DNA mismatch repair protein MSH5-like isoform X2 [Populus alba x Populus x berolinensis]KAJ6886484.1 DNA mismatch repair protein MSH5-like isoform X2 [Populus alba x Populus x berolinensis]
MEFSGRQTSVESKVTCVNKSYNCIKLIHEGAASLQCTDDIVHAGVPEEVIKRAALILDTVGSSNYVERLCNENLSAQDQLNKDTVDRMLEFDVFKGDINLFFQDIFPC